MINTPRIDDLAPLILCIEDEDSLRRDLIEELQDAGYRVIEAADGQDALMQLEASQPDLILCDISMPAMDGYELLEAFQANQKYSAETPFIFLTALAGNEEVIKGKVKGADDYLTKPIDYDLLIATVQARLRQIDKIRAHTSYKAPTPFNNDDILTPSSGTSAVLNLISTAIVLINEKKDICFVNKAAHALAEHCPEFRLALGLNQKPYVLMPNTHLCNWIKELMSSLENGNISSFHMPYDDGQQKLMFVGCKLADEDNAEPILALFITGFGEADTPSATALSALFGFTPSESLIAAALARGDKPAEIAKSLAISPTTVAFHIRNIFQKTGVSRQASLVALLLTSPANML